MPTAPPRSIGASTAYAPDHIMEFEGVSRRAYSYGWYPAFIQDRRDLEGDIPPPFKLLNVQRPNQTILLADTVQLEARKGWGNDYFVWVGGHAYNPATAENVISEAALPAGFSARHNDRGNAAFVDGHVESFAVGEIKQKHVYVEN